MRTLVALALLWAATNLAIPDMASAATAASDNPQCQKCRDACVDTVLKCFLDVCTANGGAEDSDRQCHDLDPKKVNDYLSGNHKCETTSSACYAKCISDKLCAQ